MSSKIDGNFDQQGQADNAEEKPGRAVTFGISGRPSLKPEVGSTSGNSLGVPVGRLSVALPNLSPLGGGIPEAVRLFLSALNADNVSSVTVHAVSPSLDQVDLDAWRDCQLDPHRFFGTARYFFAPTMLVSLFRANPDIVHVHGLWQFHCAAVYIWSLVTGRPYVVSPHGMLDPWIRGRAKALKALVSLLYQDRFLRRAAGFHFLTEQEKADCAEFVKGQPTSVIRNVAELPPNDSGLPSWWKPDYHGKQVFLYLGRIHEKKGCSELLDAWEELCGFHGVIRDKSVLIFCGWVDGIEGFEQRCSSLGASLGNVNFAGPQYGADKGRSFAAATYFVLPSKSEGLPMAVLEAWAAGKPSIMSVECNLDIGFQRGAAILTGTSANSIQDAIAHAAVLPVEEREAMSRRARDLVADEFSIESIRGSLLHLYKTALSWNRTRPNLRRFFGIKTKAVKTKRNTNGR